MKQAQYLEASLVPVSLLLIDLSPADLNGPLAQFQATSFTEGDMLRLVKDIGSYIGDPRFDTVLIEQSFYKWWPDFQKAVIQAIESAKGNEPKVESRPDRDILEEVLVSTRHLAHFKSRICDRNTEGIHRPRFYA